MVRDQPVIALAELSKDDPFQQVFGFNEAILSKRRYQRLGATIVLCPQDIVSRPPHSPPFGSFHEGVNLWPENHDRELTDVFAPLRLCPSHRKQG